VVAQPEPELLPLLEAVSQASLLVERAHDVAAQRETHSAPSYTFTHDLIREVMLHDMSAARRARWHRLTGEALAQWAGRDEDSLWAAQLAYHFTEARELARALPYALEAGDHAAALYAHVDAERHYQVAADL